MTTSALPALADLPLPLSLLVQPSVTITSSSVGDPVVLLTETPHYFVTGDLVTITGTPYAGTYPVTVITDVAFSIPIPSVTGTVEVGSTATRTTPVEPLTIAEGKLRAGLDWVDGDPRDELMREFIAAARAQVEADTGLALLTQVRDVYWAPSPPSAVWSDAAPPPMIAPSQTFPLQTIVGDRPGPSDGVTITRIVSGWLSVGALPPLLVHAIGLLTAHYATLGRDLASVDRTASVPMGYAEAVAAYTLVTQV